MSTKHFASIFSLVLIGLSMPLTALAQSVYGPITLERTPAQPSQFSDTFLVCNPAAEYQLVIDTAVGSKKQVASATVTLNGTKVVRPNDFKQQVTRIEKELALSGDNRLEIELSGIPGTALTLSIECVSGCLDLAFEQPIDGATLESSQVLTAGRVLNAVGEVGVSLQVTLDESSVRQAALVDADQFYVPVALQPGANTLTATATDACGYQAEQSLTVHAEAPAIDLNLSVYPPSGLVAYDTGKLTVDLTGNISSADTIASYAWDSDGDGTIDQSGAELDEITTDFSAPGIYLPTLTVTTAQGKNATATTVVQVYDALRLDAMIQPKWAGMKAELAQGDIEMALQRFAGSSQEKYRTSFGRLGDRLVDVVGNMKALRLVYAKDQIAKYDIGRDIVFDGQLRTISYPVYFSKDTDGIWKIDQF